MHDTSGCSKDRDPVHITGKSLQINIAVDSYSKFYSAKITLGVKTNLIT